MQFPLKQTKKEPAPAINFDDDKINVLLLGNSGSGKSTLINALLGREAAETGNGEAVTKNIEVYEDENLPFRMIDTVGFEYGLFRQFKIVRDLAKFSEESVKRKQAKQFIHVIWYCIDGTSKRVDQDALGYIKSVVNKWKGVPVIFVITKSYSETEVEENKQMAHDAVVAYNATHPLGKINVSDIICVVAKEYPISDTVMVAPRGLDTLLEKTNELAPKAKQLAKRTIEQIDLSLKKRECSNIISGSTAAAVAIGAIPLPVPDATILTTVQVNMLNRISKVFNLQKEELSKEITKVILQIGLTTAAGRMLGKSLKAIPGIQVAGAIVDAAVAGSITFALGSTAEIIFEKMYNGDLDINDIEEEIKKIFGEIMPDIEEQISTFLKNSTESLSDINIKQFFEALAKDKTSK